MRYKRYQDNEICFPGDFNVNLYQNGNYILKGKKSATSQGLVHTLINRHKKFCQIYSIKQFITCPTRVTCSNFSLIGYIFTNST